MKLDPHKLFEEHRGCGCTYVLPKPLVDSPMLSELPKITINIEAITTEKRANEVRATMLAMLESAMKRLRR